VFLVGSSLALAGGSNNGEPDEEEQQAQCSPTTLSVGYVDNDGPDGHPGSFFPLPFSPAAPGGTCTGTPGAPDANGCIFVGQPGSDANGSNHWDAGVIKIDNPLTGPGAVPLVVQNVTVDIGPTFTIDVWSAFFPITIPPGGTLILTEDATSFNFDTSDLPPGNEIPPTCVNDGFKPLIHVTVGTGTTQVLRTFSDTTQVLNDGGIDGLCPPVHNEGKAYVTLTEVQNKCACEKDSDENGDDNGQNGGQGNGNDE
jgi:hypothetical protein